jgi:hypothetical protein
MVRRIETFPPVTTGHIRGHGCRDLLVNCGSGRCYHSARLSGDGFPDDLPVRSLCPRMVCTRRGMIGTDVRPAWSPHINKGMFDFVVTVRLPNDMMETCRRSQRPLKHRGSKSRPR